MTANWTADEMQDLSGSTIVVTGANSGLGYEATRAFARKGGHVVMACRSEERGEEAAGSIREDFPAASLSVHECDLGDLDSVRRFAAEFEATYPALHVLCNNAGVMAIPRSETEQGVETQFGVNHLGHFALTGLLLDRLVETDGETRVVTQSSAVHERGEIDFEDLNSVDRYDSWDAYAQSKLANLLFAYELDRRLDRATLDVTSVACHPGYAATDLQRRGPEMRGSRSRLLAMKAANAVFAQSAAAGALPLLYAATQPELEGGEYIGPGGFRNMRGAPEVQRSSDRSYDREDAARLWDVSEELTGVRYDFERSVAGRAGRLADRVSETLSR
ncbi:oxidoreductase [Halalkalicoccus jeotgali]|uniref:Short-chain dehydrogenase/reductase SDR n=1 Tax=Halalkalicoccus jeotgali (strain DSM 18796 / CECT 7217 / JCM 14584 / KCTC 4019 / B3) TaxID=795797 RepID=D8J4H2_HALJB|nr:oxidoreductase [Halalkalicoccus jeotgali]ADJ13534.1 short-chain dehydrogenase/reductase SDR [Halalkalicoccus jeotgali B3]ELY32991.1 short-chain dehydrogenase/reductase SDR [Halalkalicoccus jeotgali B3]